MAIDLKNISDVHHSAMQFYDKAFLAEKTGDNDERINLLKQAFFKEKEVADLVKNMEDLEPTRSVLHRGAASLAFQLKDWLSAERLIYQGLAGNPPTEIKEELEELLNIVKFNENCEKRNINLSKEELQITLKGPAIGIGKMPTNLLNKQISHTERALFRTAERKTGKPFRKSGPPDRTIRSHLYHYISGFAGGSFNLRLQFGSDQKDLFQDFEVSEIINEFLDCMEYINNDQEEELKQRIRMRDYYENFKAIANNILPDGKNISFIGLSNMRESNEIRKTALTKRSIRLIQSVDSENSLHEFTGILQLADITGKFNRIKIKIDDGSISDYINVEDSIMDDIVKPYWNNKVKLFALEKGGKLFYKDHEAIED